jgi:alpha-glucosidase
MLALYEKMLSLRRVEPALSIGAYASIAAQGNLLAYRRQEGNERFIVALNLGSEVLAFDVPGALHGKIVLSTHLDREGEAVEGRLELRGDEGVVIRMNE